MEANEIHRCCHGQQQQHQQQQAVDPETDPSATVEAAETNEVTLQLGKRPIVFDKVRIAQPFMLAFFLLPTSISRGKRQNTALPRKGKTDGL